MSNIERTRFVPTITGVEEANRQGRLFYFFYPFTSIPVNGNLDLIVEIENEVVVIVDREYTTTSNKVEVSSYISPTYTGGTSLSIVPYNSAVPPNGITAVTAKKDASVTATGQLFDYSLIIGDPGAGNQVFGLPGGGFKTDILERYIQPNATFLIRFHNAGTTPMEGVIKFIWYEVPPTEPLL